VSRGSAAASGGMTLDQESLGVSGTGGYTTPNVFGSGKGHLLLRRLIQRRFEHNAFTSSCNYEPVWGRTELE